MIVRQRTMAVKAPFAFDKRFCFGRLDAGCGAAYHLRTLPAARPRRKETHLELAPSRPPPRLGPASAAHRGALTVPGLRAAVGIRRDRWGIPYVEADNDADAWFGLGFCHGQDRAFQLECCSCASSAAPSPSWSAPPACPSTASRAASAFTGSATEQLARPRRRRARPSRRLRARRQRRHEPRLAEAGRTSSSCSRRRPTPWTPADSPGRRQADLVHAAANWDAELARLHVLTRGRPGGAGRPRPDLSAPTSRYVAAGRQRPGRRSTAWPRIWPCSRDLCRRRRRLQQLGRRRRRAPPPAGRCWPTTRTSTPACRATGISPICARRTGPSPAAIFVGGPGVLTGHNGHAAWGVTAGLIDNTDLFREQIGPDGAQRPAGRRLRRPAAVREEVIAVKRAAVRDRARAGDAARPDPQPGAPTATARRCRCAPPGSTRCRSRGLLRLHASAVSTSSAPRSPSGLASDLAEPHLRRRTAASSAGRCSAGRRVAAQGLRHAAAARLGPGRRLGAGAGALRRRCRTAVDPPEGFLATANAKPLPDGDGPFLGVDWIDGYRLAAITPRPGRPHRLGRGRHPGVAD